MKSRQEHFEILIDACNYFTVYAYHVAMWKADIFLYTTKRIETLILLYHYNPRHTSLYLAELNSSIFTLIGCDN